MNAEKYMDLQEAIVDAGYAHEIDWCESMKPVSEEYTFWSEYAWVVINSGMKNQVAEGIWNKVKPCVTNGGSAHEVFGHKGKCNGIDLVWRDKKLLFDCYDSMPTDMKIQWLEDLPWIGGITKWHLAKNFGMDVVKPDRHLVRVAESYGMTPTEMCEDLHKITGDRIATVDGVIWRAANLGLI